VEGRGNPGGLDDKDPKRNDVEGGKRNDWVHPWGNFLMGM
jgi:hypothetical protein